MPTPVAYESQPQEEKHLLEYWHVILRRRRLVAAVALAVVVVAALRTFLMRPVYEGVVQILIERENPNVLSFKEVSQIDSAREDYYQTQYKLMQSRALVRRVIEEMNLILHPEFNAGRTPEEIAAMKGAPPETAVMERAIDRFLQVLEIRPQKNSRLVTVSVLSHRPELAAQAANKLSQLYIQQTLEFRYQTSAEAAQWLGGQITQQRKKVEEAEIQLQKVQENEGLVNLEERRVLLSQKLKDLGSTLDGLKTDALQKEALLRQMRSARDPLELPDVVKDPLFQTLSIDLASLERLEAQLLEKYLDQHPEVLKVRSQIQETRGKMAAVAQRVIRAVENDYKTALSREASVAEALEAAKAEALDLARRSFQYDSLKREVDASTEVLNSVLSRHKQTDVAQELKNSNIRIIDPAAVPRSPVRPRRVRDILLGIMFGVFLGGGFAFFAEYLDNTLKTPEDVRVYLGSPLLSVVPESVAADPKGDRPSLLVRNTSEQSPFAEGFRLLRTSLSYSWPEQKPRVLALTSTVPGEGKTTTSLNLALILGAVDGNVLLIDGDLRKPQAHLSLRMKRNPGLSDILVGKAQPSDAIQRVPGTNLSFLSSGSTVPSPADLLAAHVIRALLDGLRGIYTWILIDTPPVAAVSDALVLAPLSDGVIVVAGAEMVPRKAVAHTIERLAETGARTVGVVLNRAQVEKHSYYYGRYYAHYYGRYTGYYGVHHPQKVGVETTHGRAQ